MDISISIDEASFVFQPDEQFLSENEELNNKKWNELAHDLVDEISEKFYFLDYFGFLVRLEKGKFGYDTLFTFEKIDGSLMYLGFNSEHDAMGIYIHFSATFFKLYLDTLNIESYDLFQQWYRFSFDDNGVKRGSSYASRIDVAIDLKNSDVDLNILSEELYSKKLIVKTKTGRINQSKISSYNNDNNIETLYLGTRKSNYKLLLRIYDKKKEQFSNKGNYYQYALLLDSWIRFEMELKKEYSKQSFTLIRKCESQKELSKLLFSLFLDRYQFYYAATDNHHELTTKFFEFANEDINLLDATRPIDTSIYRSAEHIKNNSGLFSTLYKMQYITQDDEIIFEFFDYLLKEYEKYTPNDDVKKWLKNYDLIKKDNKKGLEKPWLLDLDDFDFFDNVK